METIVETTYKPALAGLAAEDRLIILSCSSDNCEDRDSGLKQILLQPLDWRYVVRAAIEHSVAPLLYRRLNLLHENDPEVSVPTAVLGDLRKLYLSSKARNERILAGSAVLFERFAQQKVEAMVLKDFSLVWEVFAEPALRPMGDIDILIRREQYAAARECLRGLDFEPLLGAYVLTLKYALGHAFHREKDNFWVDLQWNILQREWSSTTNERQFDIEQMWGAARPISVGGTTIWKPCPEHNLFHLCLHLEGHRYSELILFVEIAELLAKRQEDFDWDAFLSVVRRCDATWSVHQVLSFAVKLLQAPVPTRILAQLQSASSINPASLQPLFTPLSRLHFQLDQVRLAATPPAEVLDRMEATVRRHAAAAAELSREVERLACTTFDNGSSAFMVRCAPSERLFADTALNAFGQLTFLMLDTDISWVTEALETQGYERVKYGEACWRKAVPLTCPDAVVAASLELDYEVGIARQPELIFSELHATRISARTAVGRVLGSCFRFSSQEPSTEHIPVSIRIVPLSAEQLATYLIAVLGNQVRDRMFGIANAIDFLNRSGDVIDWERASSFARRYGRDEAFRRGMGLVEAFTGKQFVSVAEGETAGERVLISARYDPAATEPYAGLKRAFFCLWTLGLLRGMKSKLHYAAQLVLGGGDKESILLSLMGDFAQTALAPSRPRPDGIFACWVEPNELEQLSSLRAQE